MAEKTTKAYGVAAAVRRARAKAKQVVSRGKATPEEPPKADQEEQATATAPAPAPAPEPAPAAEATAQEPPKRKRGRPKGSKNKPKPEAQIKAVPPKRRGRPPKKAQAAEGAEAPPKRKPGRPKGSKNKTQAQKAAEERAKAIARAAKAGKMAARRRKGRGKELAAQATEKVKQAKASSRREPTTGQSAPPIPLRIRQLNRKERDVLARLNGAGTGAREVCTIGSLAVDCFGNFPPKQANSWVRNSLRRLVQGQLVEKVDRGSYRVSEVGRQKLTRAA